MASDLASYLAGLKAGDVVIVQDRNGFRNDKVTKVTPTQVVVGTDRYYRTNSVHRIGLLITSDKWIYRSNIIEPTPRIRMIVELRTTRDALKQPITLDTIPAMRAALDRAEAALREAGE